jgi:hypothetical protein
MEGIPSLTMIPKKLIFKKVDDLEGEKETKRFEDSHLNYRKNKELVILHKP